jgi:hypothetical protein
VRGAAFFAGALREEALLTAPFFCAAFEAVDLAGAFFAGVFWAP